MSAPTALVGLVLTSLLSLGGLATGPADDLGPYTDEDYAGSITPLEGLTALDDQVTPLDERITEVDTRTTEGEETVISLASDILFDFDEARLEGGATAKIRDLVADVPEGATVDVGGHTDSISDEEYNLELSERRAEAVAKVVRKARPDLELEVKGFGEADPVAPNEKGGEDNPEGRAQNRRVEIRFED